MKKQIRYAALVTLSLAAMFSAIPAQAAVEEELKNDAKEALTNFQNTDPSLKDFLSKAAGYAIFPTVGKGGFIVGGARGEGLVYEKTNLVAKAIMTQASIGAQIGGQSFAQLIVFETPEALNTFKGSNFEMGADLSAVAAAEGAAKAAKYQQGIAVFTMPKKGLMVQASIGGQKFKFEPILQPSSSNTNSPAKQ